MRLERVASKVINMVYNISYPMYNIVKGKMRLRRLDLITKRFSARAYSTIIEYIIIVQILPIHCLHAVCACVHGICLIL